MESKDTPFVCFSFIQRSNPSKYKANSTKYTVNDDGVIEIDDDEPEVDPNDLEFLCEVEVDNRNPELDPMKKMLIIKTEPGIDENEEQQGMNICTDKYMSLENEKKEMVMPTSLSTFEEEMQQLNKFDVESWKSQSTSHNSRCVVSTYIRFVCPQCGTLFETIVDWRDHILKEHRMDDAHTFKFTQLPNNQFQCNKCNAIVTRCTAKTLQTHYFTHLPYKAFKCRLCPYSATSIYSIISHLVSHRERKKVMTDYESSDANYKMKKMAFELECEELIAYVCPFCGLKYDTKEIWLAHINFQHNFLEKTAENRFRDHFKCTECGVEIFSQQISDLQQHLFTHLPYKLFLKCKLCNWTISRRNFMILHIANMHKKHLANQPVIPNSNGELEDGAEIIKNPDETLKNLKRKAQPVVIKNDIDNNAVLKTNDPTANRSKILNNNKSSPPLSTKKLMGIDNNKSGTGFIKTNIADRKIISSNIQRVAQTVTKKFGTTNTSQDNNKPVTSDVGKKMEYYISNASSKPSNATMNSTISKKLKTETTTKNNFNGVFALQPVHIVSAQTQGNRIIINKSITTNSAIATNSKQPSISGVRNSTGIAHSAVEVSNNYEQPTTNRGLTAISNKNGHIILSKSSSDISNSFLSGITIKPGGKIEQTVNLPSIKNENDVTNKNIRCNNIKEIMKRIGSRKNATPLSTAIRGSTETSVSTETSDSSATPVSIHRSYPISISKNTLNLSTVPVASSVKSNKSTCNSQKSITPVSSSNASHIKIGTSNIASVDTLTSKTQQIMKLSATVDNNKRISSIPIDKNCTNSNEIGRQSIGFISKPSSNVEDEDNHLSKTSSFSSDEANEQHKRYICSICNERFYTAEQRNAHKVTKHTKFQCSVCNARFFVRSALAKHKCPVAMQCNICFKEYNYMASYLKHTEVCRAEAKQRRTM